MSRTLTLALIDQIAVCVAGMEAQKLYNAPTHHGGGWGDYGRVIELLYDLEDETERRKLINEGHQRAHDLLLQHTEKTKRLAEAVLAKMSLDSEEVRSLLL